MLFVNFHIRQKQIASGGKMRPAQGPKKKFESASEQDMAEYCNFLWQLGIPKTKERFSLELVHYMDYYGIENKFAKVIPGKQKFQW